MTIKKLTQNIKVTDKSNHKNSPMVAAGNNIVKNPKLDFDINTFQYSLPKDVWAKMSSKEQKLHKARQQIVRETREKSKKKLELRYKKIIAKQEAAKTPAKKKPLKKGKKEKIRILIKRARILNKRARAVLKGLPNLRPKKLILRLPLPPELESKLSSEVLDTYYTKEWREAEEPVTKYLNAMRLFKRLLAKSSSLRLKADKVKTEPEPRSKKPAKIIKKLKHTPKYLKGAARRLSVQLKSRRLLDIKKLIKPAKKRVRLSKHAKNSDEAPLRLSYPNEEWNSLSHSQQQAVRAAQRAQKLAIKKRINKASLRLSYSNEEWNSLSYTEREAVKAAQLREKLIPLYKELDSFTTPSLRPVISQFMTKKAAKFYRRRLIDIAKDEIQADINKTSSGDSEQQKTVPNSNSELSTKNDNA